MDESNGRKRDCDIEKWCGVVKRWVSQNVPLSITEIELEIMKSAKGIYFNDQESGSCYLDIMSKEHASWENVSFLSFMYPNPTIVYICNELVKNHPEEFSQYKYVREYALSTGSSPESDVLRCCMYDRPLSTIENITVSHLSLYLRWMGRVETSDVQRVVYPKVDKVGMTYCAHKLTFTQYIIFTKRSGWICRNAVVLFQDAPDYVYDMFIDDSDKYADEYNSYYAIISNMGFMNYLIRKQRFVFPTLVHVSGSNNKQIKFLQKMGHEFKAILSFRTYVTLEDLTFYESLDYSTSFDDEFEIALKNYLKYITPAFATSAKDSSLYEYWILKLQRYPVRFSCGEIYERVKFEQKYRSDVEKKYLEYYEKCDDVSLYTHSRIMKLFGK